MFYNRDEGIGWVPEAPPMTRFFPPNALPHWGTFFPTKLYMGPTLPPPAPIRLKPLLCCCYCFRKMTLPLLLEIFVYPPDFLSIE
jgi:hypothetical protein